MDTIRNYEFVVGYPYCNPIVLSVEAEDEWVALDKMLSLLETERHLDLTLVTDVQSVRGVEYEEASKFL